MSETEGEVTDILQHLHTHATTTPLFGPSLHLGSEAILPKTDGTAEFYCLFTPICVF